MPETSVRCSSAALRLVLLPLLSVLFVPVAAQAAEDDWRSLFDGESLTGWAQIGPGRFLVEDGVLYSEGGMGMLWYTEEKFSDVTLQLEFKLGVPEANSGVFVRIPRAPENPWTAVNGGYEVQIDEGGDDYHRTGVLYSLTKALVHPRLQEWNRLEITLDGPRTQVRVNGELVTDFTEGDPVPEKQQRYEPDRGPRPLAGYIGLQNHATRDLVYFRNIAVRPLVKGE